MLQFAALNQSLSNDRSWPSAGAAIIEFCATLQTSNPLMPTLGMERAA